MEAVNMERRNEMKLEFEALSVNEGFARVAVAAFCCPDESHSG